MLFSGGLYILAAVLGIPFLPIKDGTVAQNGQNEPNRGYRRGPFVLLVTVGSPTHLERERGLFGWLQR